MSQANNYHEEEALGKAYDARLMRRLMQYIRPYRGWLALAFWLGVCTATVRAVPFDQRTGRWLIDARSRGMLQEVR